MAYLAPTLATAQSLLAGRLADPGMVHFQPAELTRYLRESMRTWQALTASTKVSAVFATTLPAFDPAYFDPAYFGALIQTFYDLPTMVPSVRAYTVLVTDLLTDLEYALVEPPTANWNAWTGTAQFALSDLVTAVQQRRDRFLSETRAVVTYEALPVGPSPPAGRFVVDPTILAVQRLAWQDGQTGLITPLRRDDEWGLNNFSAPWPLNPSRPNVYSTSVTPPLQIQLGPPPLASGQLDACVIVQGAAVNPLIATQTLGMPDDWTWVVKWGALADLLGRDGLALDVSRSQYCEERWQQGIDLAKAAQVVITARVNNAPVRVETLANLDAYKATWQTFPGRPAVVAVIGHNLVALAPPPANGPWSITLDLVPNMPVPVLPLDALQLSGDVLDVILDYAAHLAAFKLGPAELEATKPLLDRFLGAAGHSMARRKPWAGNRATPHSPLPDNEWAAGTTVDPVGVA